MFKAAPYELEITKVALKGLNEAIKRDFEDSSESIYATEYLRLDPDLEKLSGLIMHRNKWVAENAKALLETLESAKTCSELQEIPIPSSG